VPTQRLSDGATKHVVRQMITERSKLYKVRSRSAVSHAAALFLFVVASTLRLGAPY
jgi:hypothetical protein